MHPDTDSPAHWLHALFILLCFPLSVPAATVDEKELLAALGAGNHVALIRHALAPGVGDPDTFTLGDCSTQRNLSAAGREQAARIGERLKEGGLGAADVFTSQWCRCRETALLLGLSTPVEQPLLNSFFAESHLRNQQTDRLITWLASQELSRPLILVTHQVNITAFTAIFPQSGEIVVMRRNPDNTFELAGTIRTTP